MKILISFFKKFIPKEIQKPLGRWSNDYCNLKINKKIDFSNEDHCGPCGNYGLYKKHFNKSDKK